jgi:hypothetical protein
MLRKIPVTVRKGSGNTPGKGEFDLRAQARKVCSHKFSGGQKRSLQSSLFVRLWQILHQPLTLVNFADLESLAFAIPSRQNSPMAHRLTTSYTQDSIDLFRHYKQLAERAIQQCPEESLFATLDDESNSIAIIVKHMAGNMRSRWTDFLTTDGEKPDRNRDSEFEEPPKNRAELIAMWERDWKIVFDALEPLTEADLARTITIRTEPHSVMQAINRQIAHYAYHVGQIVFLAKHFTAKSTGNWTSLTVPRNKSNQFNADVAAGHKSQR